MLRGMRGQVAIEFVIIVAVSLVYLAGVVMPNAQKAQAAALDATQITLARQAVDQIGQAVFEADSNPGDSSRVLEIVVPEDTNVSCMPSIIISPATRTDLNFFSQPASGLPLPSGCRPITDIRPSGSTLPNNVPDCNFGYSFRAPKIVSAVDCQFGTLAPRSMRYRKTLTVAKTNGTIVIHD